MLSSIDLMSLRPDDRWVYEGGLWVLAVRERTSVLPKWKYGAVNLGRILNVSTKYLRLALRRIADKSLIELIEEETVIVIGVKERHRKLIWRDLPVRYISGNNTHPRNVPETGGELERLENRDISTDPDTEIVTQRPDRPESEPNPGAVDRNSIKSESDQTGGGPISVGELLEEQSRRWRERKATAPDPRGELPWKRQEESEIERDVHDWFLHLWPHGEYDWEAEKASLMSQVRKHGPGCYAYARAQLIERRNENFNFRFGELAYLNGIAREQGKKVSTK
jgi:hypothetical protein